MSRLQHARGFQELVVYQKSRQLAQEIRALTASFPKEEKFSLTDQIRRSSRAVGANLAEAWAKRRYEKHFISKLTDSDGEQMETQHWLGVALDCGYLDKTTYEGLTAQCLEIGRMLGSMMDKASLFCGEISSSIRESPAPYITSDDFFTTDLDH